ncbi:MAG: TraB/GumN family protein [Thermoplasmata archaeon]|nr:TraB/GumN family protein [Thermoplasmata archaeon]
MYSSTVESPVLLLGVAHVIDLESALRKALADRPLDGVALELDDERAQHVLSASPPQGSNVGSPIFLRLWAHMQKRLGDEMGDGAGGEMRAAAGIAKERALPIFLIDDPIRETLRKLIASMSFKERISLLVGGFIGLVIPSRLVKDQLDAYNEAPGDYLDAIRQAYPGVARVLLDDRNEHMADRLGSLRSKGFGRVAAVVGDAHVPGLSAALRRRGIPVETISFATLQATTASAGGPVPSGPATP